MGEEKGHDLATALDYLKADNVEVQVNECDKKIDTFAGRDKKEPNTAFPVEEQMDNPDATLGEELLEDSITRSGNVESPSEKGRDVEKGHELSTSLDYLKADSVVDQNTQKTGAESEVSNNEPQIEGHKELISLAKSVVRNVENIEDIKTKLSSEKTGMFNCVFCDRDMHSKMKMLHHIDMHVKLLKQPLQSCSVCGIRLPEIFICLHQESHDYPIKSVPSGIVCAPRDMRNDVAYFLTERLGKQQKVYKCWYCQSEFSRLYCLKRHYIRQHTTKYICQECGTSADALTEICKHLKIHRQMNSRIVVEDLKFNVEEGDICCPYCHIKFSNQSSLTRHLKCEHVDTDFLKFSCTKCRKSFISSTALNFHLQTHDELFACKMETCTKVFKTHRQLLNHEQIHSKREKTKSLCPYCGQAYSTRSRLNEHIEFEHNGRKPIECDICGSKFRSTDAHRRHMKTHLDSSNYVCEQCGERFKTSQYLWHHKKKHLEKKRFKCLTCQAAFNKPESLQIHLVNHKHFSEQQPESLIKYKTCSHCGKKLTNYHQLTRHIETKHSEPKKCTYCDKKFRDRSNLRVHLQSHTNTKPRCKACNAVFRSTLKLNEHMATFHPSMACLIEKSVQKGFAIEPDISSFQGNRNNSTATAVTL